MFGKMDPIFTNGKAYPRSSTAQDRFGVVLGPVQKINLPVFDYGGRIKNIGPLPTYGLLTDGAKEC
jgi:hypothetical protein